MGIHNDRIVFGDGELLIMGGDYGELELTARDEAGRRTLETLIGRARRGGDVFVRGLVIDVTYAEEREFETRDAGLSGTHERGATFTPGADGSEGEKDLAAEGDRSGPA